MAITVPMMKLIKTDFKGNGYFQALVKILHASHMSEVYLNTFHTSVGNRKEAK